ncbi:hypothetical protein SB87_gp106 [Parapoxvirus red deer/HL953]|uniref:Uncharacterized protein n=1 Tax=Parapoxvirus red deer/HL953 TaxID=1579460 RepID=A0A0A7MA15_9POXV|nr:hypothetical protein SB87_gp106 [Parapoxvirus red deer/HL953]AIZ77359.1 hypothetical protein [Parapoxvirus red deer/HL953]
MVLYATELLPALAKCLLTECVASALAALLRLSLLRPSRAWRGAAGPPGAPRPKQD